MNIFQIQAELESYRSMKDRGLRLTFDTGENITPEMMANIHYGWQKAGFLIFSADPFTSSQIEELSKIKIDFDDTGKTPGQRMRGVLFRNWEVNNEGYTVFEDFYKAKYEIMINHWKKKLP